MIEIVKEECSTAWDDGYASRSKEVERLAESIRVNAEGAIADRRDDSHVHHSLSMIAEDALPSSGERAHMPTIRALLDLFQVDGNSDGWSYNHSNDYGVIYLKLWTGKGSPWPQFFGLEIEHEYAIGNTGKTEIRGSGTYKLNEAAAQLIARKIAGEEL